MEKGVAHFRKDGSVILLRLENIGPRERFDKLLTQIKKETHCAWNEQNHAQQLTSDKFYEAVYLCKQLSLQIKIESPAKGYSTQPSLF